MKIHARSGFTLVEILVAVTLFMIVIGAIYGTIQAGNASVAKTEERVDVYQTARIVLDQMVSELSSAYQPSETKQSTLIGEDTPGEETAPQYDKLTFLTTSHHASNTSEPASDVCKVSYTVHVTPEGEPLGLYMEEDLHPGLSMNSEPANPVRLSDLVVGINFQYFDSDTEEWQKEWVDRKTLPKAVRIELAVKPLRSDAKPIIIAATTNLSVVSTSAKKAAIPPPTFPAGNNPPGVPNGR